MTKRGGVYTKFLQYTTNVTKKTGWCQKTGEWLYINPDGTIHPHGSLNPSIMFTAPEDGIYYFGITYKRDNQAGNNIRNPFTFYLRYVIRDNDKLTSASNVSLYSNTYGDINDGVEILKQANNVNCFINLKSGDKISMEIDANGVNASGQNTISRFVVARTVNGTNTFDETYISNTGFTKYDPYHIDFTTLNATIEKAKTLQTTAQNNNGYESGQYNPNKLADLNTAISAADEFEANHDGKTQADADNLNTTLENAMEVLKNSITGYPYTPGSKIALKVSGTDKYFIRKNKTSNHYYAAYYSLSDMLTNDKANIRELRWEFDVTVNTNGGYNLAVNNEYVTKDAYVASDANADDSRLTFWTQDSSGDVIGVRRESDMKYWTSTIYWNKPYNKVGTQDIPVYNLEVCTAPAATPYDYLRSLSESDDNSTKMTLCKDAGITMDVVLTRILSNSYWNTFCVPFNISAEQISSTFGGAQITEFTSVDGTTMNFREARSIVAGKPYLIKPVKTVENPTFSGVTITVTEPEQTTKGDYGFKGTLQPTPLATDGTNLFVSTTGEVKKPSATGNTIKGFRAYIIVPKTVGESAKLSILGEVTGIDSISNGNGSDNGIIYNLSGQRVDGNAKGIVVKNGKKVIMSK